MSLDGRIFCLFSNFESTDLMPNLNQIFSIKSKIQKIKFWYQANRLTKQTNYFAIWRQILVLASLVISFKNGLEYFQIRQKYRKVKSEKI